MTQRRLSCFRTVVELIWNEFRPRSACPILLKQKLQRETMLLKRLRRHVGRRTKRIPTRPSITDWGG